MLSFYFDLRRYFFLLIWSLFKSRFCKHFWFRTNKWFIKIRNCGIYEKTLFNSQQNWKILKGFIFQKYMQGFPPIITFNNTKMKLKQIKLRNFWRWYRQEIIANFERMNYERNGASKFVGLHPKLELFLTIFVNESWSAILNVQTSFTTSLQVNHF